MTIHEVLMSRRGPVPAYFYYALVMLLGLAGMLVAPPSRAQFFNQITVTTNADDFTNNGNCTLREAIIAANTNTAVDACASGSSTLADEIVFATSTNGKTIVLNRLGAGEDAAATGDLDITSNASNTSNDVYILGNGTGATIIDGDQADRVFEVLGTAGLTLENLTVTRGAGVSTGAGIYAHNTTTLSLNGVLITNNIATAPTTATGGAIEADNNLYINNSFVVGNRAEGTGNGNAIGGGIAMYSTGTKTITRTIISNNIVKTASGLAQGGGIFKQTGILTVSDSILDNNQSTTDTGSALGGGIQVDSGTLDLNRVQLSNNLAQFTGSSGQANGGAISSRNTVALINSTLVGNQAHYGAGLYLYSNSSKATLHGGTIARNTAFKGGGVYVVSAATLDLYGTILAANIATNSAPDCDDNGASGVVTTDGYNLVGENDGCTLNINGSSEQIGTASSPIDPMLGTLQLVAGAPTPTYVLPLLPGSPAIDAGDTQLTSAGGTCESPDQVGDTRPQDDNQDGSAACDIGAVEYVQASSSGSGSSSSTSTTGGGGAMGLPVLGLLLLLVVFVRLEHGKGRHQP